MNPVSTDLYAKGYDDTTRWLRRKTAAQARRLLTIKTTTQAAGPYTLGCIAALHSYLASLADSRRPLL